MQEDTSVWERDMYKRKIEKDIRCPLEYGLEVFGGKWNSRIICVLAAMKILRYSELRKEMGNITDASSGISIKRADRKWYCKTPVL